LETFEVTEIRHNSNDIESWLKVKGADGVGPVTFAKLLKRIGPPQQILKASVSELAKTEGIGTKTAERIVATRNNFDAQAEIELARKLDVQIINIQDDRYPPVLKKIDDPPPVLYIKGDITRRDNLAISIVGSRQCSLYGQEQSSRLAHLLASAGFTICSGLARGIDTAAHHGALSAGGRTIAVLGCGLANMFPPENKKLSELIAQSGACISELPLRSEPLAMNFPPRNRIIAGLSLGTIVIEAGLRSGAMITADAATSYNREVMAVPGKIDSPLNKGAHYLIKQGAKLVESIEDVMEALGYYGEQLKEYAVKEASDAEDKLEQPLFNASQLNLTDDEKTIYNFLNKEPTHLEQIIADTNLNTGGISACLISLQLKGLVKQLPGSLFIRK
jgi:DNA processing protein